MSNNFNQQANITYSVSRGRETYGYNIVTLKSPNGKFRAMGGGYDMLGTVFGKWLETILTVADLKKAKTDGLYGVTLRCDDTYALQGGCGLECMIDVAKHCGYTVKKLYSYDRKGRVKDVIGFTITKGGQA